MNEASFGGAMMTQLGKKLNPFNRSGESQMSIKDRMAQQQFVSDLVGKAASAINQGIRTGLIDPSTKIEKTPVPPAQIGTNVKNPISTPTAPATAPAKGTAPVAPTTAPAAKMTPQQTAALKGRLKAGASATSAQSGFKNYVGGSGERMTGVDKSGAPIFKKIQRENKFEQLDAIFESIISMDEAPAKYSYTISSYLQEFLKQYMGGMDVTSLQPMINQVQSSFKSGGGSKALNKLASAAYSLYLTGGAGAEEKVDTPDKSKETTKVNAKGSSLADIISGNPSAASAEPQSSTTTSAPGAATASVGTTSPINPAAEPTTTATSPAAEPAKSNAMEPTKASPEKVKSVYMQVKDLVNKLDKKGKQRILTTLEKEVGAEPSIKATPKTDTTSTGANAFGQMAGQLAARPTPSSTGGTTTGVSGVGSGVVKHTAGKGTKVKQAKAQRTKKATTTPAVTSAPKTKATKKASPLPVAESKTYKVWGQK